jgi:Ca2+-binding RTX toxin-like protein
MTTYIFQSNITSLTTVASLASGDDALIMPGVTIDCDATAVEGLGSGHQVSVIGHVISKMDAVRLGQDEFSTGQILTVGSTGSIYSEAGAGAVISGGNSHVENAGSIYSDGEYGLKLNGIDVIIEDCGIAVTQIDNSGTIAAAGTAIFSASTSTQHLYLYNAGTIEGGLYSFYSAGVDAVDKITNEGAMIGNVYLGSGDDRFSFLVGGTVIGDVDLGSGDDYLDMDQGTIQGAISAGDGDDEVNGSIGNDRIDGEDGDDDIFGDEGDDQIYGGDGFDKLYGGSGDDYIDGGSGNDWLEGGYGADLLVGGAGDDIYIFSVGDRIVETRGGGRDKVYGSVDIDLGLGDIGEPFPIPDIDGCEDIELTGDGSVNGAGNDADNVITGNRGANVLLGRLGADRLDGAFGDDTLDGGDGNDTLDGGYGSDTLIGGDGCDIFFVSTALSATNVDTIMDLDTAAGDRISLSSAIFGQPRGTLAESAFKIIGASAPGAVVDGDDRILYDMAAGIIYFDGDGSGQADPATMMFKLGDPYTRLTAHNIDFF